MIKAILFDFDGTISNRSENAYNVFDDFFKDYFPNFDEIEYEALLQDMLIFDHNGTTKMNYRLPAFMAKYGHLLPNDFEKKFTDYFYSNMWKYCVIKPEARQVLAKLKEKYKLAIISNGSSKPQHDKIDYLMIDEYFDEILVGGDYDIQKPDVRIFKIAAEKLKVEPQECMFVGDVFSTDILGAIKANMTPVYVLQDKEKPTRHYHGYKIDDLRQLFEILKDM